MKQIVQDKIDKINSILSRVNPDNDTFMGGTLGLAYYYYQTYKASGQREYLKNSTSMITDVFDRLNSGSPMLYGSSLSSGATGLGYVVNAIENADFPEIAIGKQLKGLDKYLFSTAETQIENDVIDYLHGALGTLLYFSTRTSSPHSKDYIDRLIEKLFSRMVKEKDGYWLRNHFLENSKDTVNFGLAHGLSGSLMILIKCYECSSQKEMIKQMVREAVRFICNYKMDINFSQDCYSFFPFSFHRNSEEISAPNRMAWCYGDLNEVLLLYRAGYLLNDGSLIYLADLIGSSSLLRKDKNSTCVSDSHFCHGSSGLAQIYKSLYNETRLDIYNEAYEYWIEQTILLFEEDLNKSIYAGKEASLLEGMVGVGLSLLSYVSDKNLEWSKALLL